MRGIGISTLMLVGLAGCGHSSSMMSPTGTRLAPVAGQQVLVTSTGFAPATITASVGVPCTLMVTRTTDMACAREFVMPMHGIAQPLPLGQPVQIIFTHMEPGEVPFTCQMGMMNGTVMVR